MKIAHLTTVDLSLRFLVFAQLEALRDEGHEVIGISAPGPWVADLERVGIRHVPLQSSTRGANVGADVRSALELWRVLRRERPDVLHTHNPKPGVYGRIIGRMAGVPIVINTVHGLYATPEDPLARRIAVYGLEAVASRFSDAELVQNPEDFELMRRMRLTRRARLIGNGVDLERFDPARFTSDERRALRTELGLGADQVVIGTVGRLVAEKGYPELFAAVRRLDPDRYVLVVIGAGDPEKRDALAPDLLARARADGVRFLGHRDDVDALYAAMDIFVLASQREGYPRAAMEAAAMGLPIVATDIRGCREVVRPGRNGLLVPPRDASSIVAAITKLGGNADQRAAMGDAGRTIARERFDEQRVAGVVLDTYGELATLKGISREPIDVLHVITSNDRRGAEVDALELAAALGRRGYRPRVVALAPGPFGGGLAVPTLGQQPLSFATLRRLRREAGSAAIVIAHGSKTLPACAAALVGTGVPFVYRNIGDPEQWSTTAARRARVRAYLRRADAVVALTPRAATSIRARYGVAPERVTVIPIGVSAERHRPADSASRREARDVLHITDDAPVAAIIGALSAEKNVALAIDAAVDIPGLQLIVTGAGPEEGALRRRASLRAPERVHFTGRMRDPRLALAAADVVLLTSRTEGLPSVLVEAGMSELPVVATDVGYVDEIVANGQTGFLVDPGDRHELVAAITRVLDDGRELGRRARVHCQGRFDLEGVAAVWDALLSGLSGRRPEPEPALQCSGTSAAPTLRTAAVGRTASIRAGLKER
ncbi:MAG TPA: glycosyltransferase [Acidimicrobiia bacterium]|nr:glycosyltransferase [Acidimicrobiia bacterium]